MSDSTFRESTMRGMTSAEIYFPDYFEIYDPYNCPCIRKTYAAHLS